MRNHVPGNPRRPSSAIPPKSTLAILFFSTILLTLLPLAWAGAWKGTCDIRFQGTSTLHDFTGHVRCQPFQVAAEDAASGQTIIPGARVAVLAGEMDTDNGKRDRQMRQMFESDQFPRILGAFGKIDPEKIRRELRRGPEATVPLDFALTIREIERPVHAVASNFRETDAEVSFDVEYAVSLKEFRLVPPKVAFGLVRVGDRVTVKAAVRLEAATPK